MTHPGDKSTPAPTTVDAFEWRACAVDDGSLLPDETGWFETLEEAEAQAAFLRADADPPFDDVWIERRPVGAAERIA